MLNPDSDRTTVIGTLKGYDQLMNLVLDEVKEAMTGMSSVALHLCLVLTSFQTKKAMSATENSASSSPAAPSSS
jgi:small nuclear ribonucleoprotein (snRNP)-like protein